MGPGLAPRCFPITGAKEECGVTQKEAERREGGRGEAFLCQQLLLTSLVKDPPGWSWSPGQSPFLGTGAPHRLSGSQRDAARETETEIRRQKELGGGAGDGEREARDGWRERVAETGGDTKRTRGTCVPPGQIRGAAPIPLLHPPHVPKASPLASRNSLTRTQPQRRPHLKGNPGKPRAARVPPRGGEEGGRGGDPEKARLCPSPPTSSSLPLSHAPNPPGLFPTHQPHPEGKGKWERRGSQTPAPSPTPTPARAVVAQTLVLCLRFSRYLSLFPFVSHDLFAQKLGLGAGIPQREAHSVFLCALPHRTPPPAKFRSTLGDTWKRQRWREGRQRDSAWAPAESSP